LQVIRLEALASLVLADVDLVTAQRHQINAQRAAGIGAGGSWALYGRPLAREQSPRGGPRWERFYWEHARDQGRQEWGTPV
jgi:hypothetical protein